MASAVIFLVRHGETERNRVHRYQGWGDSPLTSRGVSQAQAIGRRLCTLREAEAAEIVASPIGRTQRTAEIIRGQIAADGLGCAANLRFDERWREISIGAWDGLDRDGIAALAPGIFDGDGRHEWYFRTPDGLRSRHAGRHDQDVDCKLTNRPLKRGNLIPRAPRRASARPAVCPWRGDVRSGSRRDRRPFGCR
jgi:broad specificity phosphatase PhoE